MTAVERFAILLTVIPSCIGALGWAVKSWMGGIAADIARLVTLSDAMSTSLTNVRERVAALEALAGIAHRDGDLGR